MSFSEGTLPSGAKPVRRCCSQSGALTAWPTLAPPALRGAGRLGLEGERLSLSPLKLPPYSGCLAAAGAVHCAQHLLCLGVQSPDLRRSPRLHHRRASDLALRIRLRLQLPRQGTAEPRVRGNGEVAVLCKQGRRLEMLASFGVETGKLLERLVCQPVLREHVADEVLELSDALGLWRRLPESLLQCAERVLVLWELRSLFMRLLVVVCFVRYMFVYDCICLFMC